jgi:hypothetical protein
MSLQAGEGEEMLIDEPRVLVRDPILEMIGSANGNRQSSRLQQGIYQITHFGSSHFLRDGYEEYPEDLPVNCYGVCDTVEQLLAACPELEGDPERQFVVTLTPVLKANQPDEGGWRWHKWGPYIGTHTPTTEYLCDEPDIDGVLIYSIYEKSK